MSQLEQRKEDKFATLAKVSHSRDLDRKNSKQFRKNSYGSKLYRMLLPLKRMSQNILCDKCQGFTIKTPLRKWLFFLDLAKKVPL